MVDFLGDTGRGIADCKAPKHFNARGEGSPEWRQLHVQKKLHEQDLKLRYGELRDFIVRSESVSPESAERDIRAMRKARQIWLKGGRGGRYVAAPPVAPRARSVSAARVKAPKSPIPQRKALPREPSSRGGPSPGSRPMQCF